MKNTEQLVSVIITTYNREELVCRAIQSVLDQSYSDVEVVIIDDGSTDNSWEKIIAYGGSIRPLRIDNRGVSGARNMGFDLSKGEYIMFLDSDDYLEKDAVAKLMAVRVHHNSDVVVFGQTKTIDEFGVVRNGQEYNYIKDRDFAVDKGLLLSRCLSISLMLFTRKQFNQNGLFKDGMSYGEDYELTTRMEGNGVSFIPINEHTHYVYVHTGERLSRNVKLEDFVEFYNVVLHNWDENKQYLRANENADRIKRLSQWLWGIGRFAHKNKHTQVANKYIDLALEIGGEDAKKGNMKLFYIYKVIPPEKMEQIISIYENIKYIFKKIKFTKKRFS